LLEWERGEMVKGSAWVGGACGVVVEAWGREK